MCTYYLFIYKPMIRVIVFIPTGKREDLWESHVKRLKVFKCLGAYMSIS